MGYNNMLIRKAASLARRLGFRTIVSDSCTTESAYLHVGLPSRHGGFETLAILRVSNHPQPGYENGGWHHTAIGLGLYFDLRPRSRCYDDERVNKFLLTVRSKERGKRVT